MSKRKITVKQLQQICGFLNLLCKCIVPGRAFTRQMYSYASTKNASKLLMSHHHIRVSREIKLDLNMWSQVLEHPLVYCRHFLDFESYISANEIRFFMDASGNFKLGMGGVCERSWFTKMWDSNFMKTYNPSIEYLELYALVTGIFAVDTQIQEQKSGHFLR